MTEVARHLPATLRPYYLAEAIGVAAAARQAGKSMRTMREWCARHRIGRMIGGRARRRQRQPGSLPQR
jgi:hypothetical protein